MNNYIGSKPVYDTVEGINSFLSDLNGLINLAKLRRDAYYLRKEQLDSFIVLGRFVLDRCGNFSIILKEGSRQVIPAEVVYDIPNVISYDNMFKYIKDDSSICSTEYSLPPTYVKCSICDEPFNIKNCHDVKSSSKNERYNLNKFIGQYLADIKQLPEFINRIPHHVSHEYVVSEKYINIDGGNSKGAKSVSKDDIIKEGDNASVTLYHYTHNECNRLNVIEDSLDRFKSIIKASYFSLEEGDLKFEINGIANRYCPCDTCPPWYIVRIEGLDPIIIGWRKSVINIDWSKSGKDLLHLFEDQNVTKDKYMVHAHGYDKCIDYLNKIIGALRDSNV